MHNFYGVRNKVDNFRKGLFLDPYDQPTYLTFAIDFKFESIPEDGITGTNTTIDPLWKSPLFEKGSEENYNSAQTYLGSIGYKDREERIAKFKSILEYLTFNAPWYFQSISGLDKMWEISTNMSDARKSKSATITIDTMEAIDLRITQLANLYRSSIYDTVYMRELVPDNLRWFCMDVYIAEARNIRYNPAGQFSNVASAIGIDTSGINRFLTNAGSAASSLLGNRELDQSSPLKQFGFVKFKCRQCEFDFSGSFPGGQKLDVSMETTAKPVASSFKINVGYFEEESEYNDATKITEDPATSSIRNPWNARNTAANLQTRIEGASDLPFVGGFVDNARQYSQDRLQTIGGLVNPALRAAFNSSGIRSIGDLYAGNNPFTDGEGKEIDGNFPREDRSIASRAQALLNSTIYPDKFPNNDGDRNLGRIY
jgi:hypothetical protein